MTQKLNSFERIWKELKRRKVVHVVTVYAATAFVILELVSMVAQPLKLPEWTEAFVIVLLCIGFVIAVLLSWIYDITPAGVKKTKPASAVKHIDQTTTPNSSGWKIATYISAVIILAFVAFNIISIRNLNADISKLEKSIAVLPFINDSPDTTNAYFINGIMARITINLQMVKELRVISRNSVEKYRNNKNKSTPEIAKELGVNYIIAGSGQKYGKTFSLVVQLIKAKDKETPLWAKPYEKEIKEVNDYIKVMSEVAQAIAEELKAVLSPIEKQLIEKIPTASLTADDFYQRGIEELTKYEVDNRNKAALQNAEDSFYKALKYDSTFAQAYTGLASVYWSKHYWNEYFSENFMDSILIFTNKALSIDAQLSDAYILKGNYYYTKGLIDKAVKEYDIALKYNPNDYQAYIQKTFISYALKDYVATFDNAFKVINRYHGGMTPKYLRFLAQFYSDVGFIDKAKYYYNEAYKLDGDSAIYFRNIAGLEWNNENFDAAMIWQKKSFELILYLIGIIWLD